MITQLKLLYLLARPAVVLLFGLFTAIGAASSGATGDRLRFAEALAAVFAFLMFSVAINDLSDVAIDSVNLPSDRRRPLVAGSVGVSQMKALAACSGVLCLGLSLVVSLPALIVMSIGMLLSAGYSVRPVRIADRGAAAALLLPACYTATPYLVGFAAGRGTLQASNVLVLAGLYLGFLGRILLKDFRDVRGDVLFGKRTFLVRHGRPATCVISALMWSSGSALLEAAGLGGTFGLMTGAIAIAVVALLIALARSDSHRRDEVLISAIAILGRGLLVVVLASIELGQRQVAGAMTNALVVGLTLLSASQATTMLRRGPRPQWIVVPACQSADDVVRAAPVG